MLLDLGVSPNGNRFHIIMILSYYPTDITSVVISFPFDYSPLELSRDGLTALSMTKNVATQKLLTEAMKNDRSGSDRSDEEF